MLNNNEREHLIEDDRIALT